MRYTNKLALPRLALVSKNIYFFNFLIVCPVSQRLVNCELLGDLGCLYFYLRQECYVFGSLWVSGLVEWFAK